MDVSTPRKLYVEWMDHAFHSGSVDETAASKLGLSSQSSLGYLAAEDHDIIALAQTYTVHHDGQVEFGDVLTVGKAMVRVVKELTFSTTGVDSNVVA